MCPPSILRCCRVYRDFLDVGYVCLSVSIYKVIVFSFVFNHGVWKELEKMSSLVHKNVKFGFFFWVWQVVLVRKMGLKFWVLFGLDLSTGICLFWVIVCIKMLFLFFFFFCLIAVKYRRRETKYWICVCLLALKMEIEVNVTLLTKVLSSKIPGLCFVLWIAGLFDAPHVITFDFFMWSNENIFCFVNALLFIDPVRQACCLHLSNWDLIKYRSVNYERINSD